MGIHAFINKWLWVVGLVTMTLMANANPVDIETARKVGAKFLNTNTTTRVANDADLQCVKVYRMENGTAAFYVFNTSTGYVMVSADNLAVPILGYSEKEPFDENNMPDAMENYLQGFVEQIQYAVTHPFEADQKTVHQWELVRTVGRIKDQRNDKVVQPLVSAHWGQGCYYNDLCPIDMQGPCNHALVGCVAVAMGQIMHYWGYPTTGNGSHSYKPIDPTTFGPSFYPDQMVDFGASIYNWESMPDTLNENSEHVEIEAVATMLWHCGVSVEMMYGANSSGAYSNDVPYALQHYFMYSPDMHGIYRNDYSSEQWVEQIKTYLDLNQPVYYSGSDVLGHGGHAFVCDGYDENDFLHFNWGWYGNLNDYFADGALNVSNYQFNNNNFAIINIHPECTSGMNFQITATTDDSEVGTVTGTGIYECGSNCTLTATPYAGYDFCSWTEDGTVVSMNSTYSFLVSRDRNLVANFMDYLGETCSIVFELNDDYGDGWNDNFLTVSYSAGCISEEQLTIYSGNLETFTRHVVNGSHIVLGWIPGSYIGECSFSVRYADGDLIFTEQYISSALYFEFDVVCPGSYAITTEVHPVQSGTVTGGGIYNEGSVCTLTATPNPGYSFVNWTKEATVVSTEPTFSFTVTENDTYTANFFLMSYNVSVSADPIEGGVVTGDGIYDHGSTVTVSVTPNDHYEFLRWTENGEEVSIDTNYTFIVTENRNLVAQLSFIDDVDEHVASKINVYPNPAHHQIVVECGHGIVRYEVYTVSGHLISTKDVASEKEIIPIGDLPSGMYLLKVITSNHAITKRFTKK